MLLLTGVTNLSMLPAVRLLHRAGRRWEASVGAFTCFTSFMYHCADSLHTPLFGLSDGSWHRYCRYTVALLQLRGYFLLRDCFCAAALLCHRPTLFREHCSPASCAFGSLCSLDNIGAITSFGTLALGFAGLHEAATREYLHYGYLALVLVAQEAGPWDVRFTVGPIALCGCYLAMRVATDEAGARPPLRTPELLRGLAWLAAAIAFFARALDDHHDTYRAFHGCWHLCVGAAAYYLWQALVVVEPGTKLP